jgi:prepilin-type processing-associated H-X9-DG protein
VPNPGRTLLYLENAGLYAWRQNYGEDDCSNPSTDEILIDDLIRGWHGRPFRFNVAYVDGHVAPVHMDGHLQEQPDLGRFPDYNGNPQDYDFWHCVIIRGLDWQKDTLPAPPVPTDIDCFEPAAPQDITQMEQLTAMRE